MSMFEAKIFVGFKIEGSIDNFLKMSDPVLISNFLNPELPYLSKIEYNDFTYIGKFILGPHSINDLELLQVNILSLIKKIAPSSTLNPRSMEIIPLVEAHATR